MIRTASGAALAILMLSADPTQAQVLSYFATLSGPAESPPNASPGIGTGQVDYNPATHMMRVRETFSGLLGTTTASHIHAPTAVPFAGTAGVATQTPSFVGFPLGVTSGTFDNTYDMTMASSYNPAYITANGGTPATAEAALALALSNGTSYLNIHSTSFPGGEIRGFLAVPEPGSLALTGLAALASVRLLRRRRHAARATTPGK